MQTAGTYYQFAKVHSVIFCMIRCGHLSIDVICEAFARMKLLFFLWVITIIHIFIDMCRHVSTVQMGIDGRWDRWDDEIFKIDHSSPCLMKPHAGTSWGPGFWSIVTARSESVWKLRPFCYLVASHAVNRKCLSTNKSSQSSLIFPLSFRCHAFAFPMFRSFLHAGAQHFGHQHWVPFVRRACSGHRIQQWNQLTTHNLTFSSAIFQFHHWGLLLNQNHDRNLRQRRWVIDLGDDCCSDLWARSRRTQHHRFGECPRRQPPGRSGMFSWCGWCWNWKSILFKSSNLLWRLWNYRLLSSKHLPKLPLLFDVFDVFGLAGYSSVVDGTRQERFLHWHAMVVSTAVGLMSPEHDSVAFDLLFAMWLIQLIHCILFSIPPKTWLKILVLNGSFVAWR